MSPPSGRRTSLPATSVPTFLARLALLTSSHLSLHTPHLRNRAEQAAVVCRDSANRWTDNVFTLQTWMRKKFPGQEGALAGFFKEQGAGEDFDYVS